MDPIRVLGIALPLFGIIVFVMAAPASRHAFMSRIRDLLGREEVSPGTGDDPDQDHNEVTEEERFLSENSSIFRHWT
jgi:hypothetical protein